MQLETFLFGKIDVADDAILTFPEGLSGFPDNTRFTLVHEQPQDQTPLSFTLQSVDDPMIAMQIADPAIYGFHYELELTDGELATLKVTDAADVAVMLVLFRREETPGPIEANIRAPLLINTRTRLGIQKLVPNVTSKITLSNLSTSVA